jgi:hypothetical protein
MSYPLLYIGTYHCAKLHFSSKTDRKYALKPIEIDGPLFRHQMKSLLKPSFKSSLSPSLKLILGKR